MNILVTAVGGDIGQSIVKTLRTWDKVQKIVGTDVTDKNAGGFIVDVFYIVPFASDERYIDTIQELIRKEDIDFVIPISENELLVFNEVIKNNSPLSSKSILARGNSITMLFDKYNCIELIKAAGLAVPNTEEGKNIPTIYPCIMKNRKGSGSKGLKILNDERDYKYYKRILGEVIIQEYLTPHNQEYTCGVYKALNEEPQVIVLLRELYGGFSGYAEVVKDEEIEDYCKRIATFINLEGSINIQLIKTAEGPKLFEINPRFSSTAIFRNHVGFKDVIWSIQDKIPGEKKTPFNYNNALGKKFYRIYSELFC